MIKYPLFFGVSTSSTKGVNTPIESRALDLPPIGCAIPTEFGGPGGGYSPEDLFSLALLSCFIATFKVFAEKAELAYTTIAGEAKLTIDRNADGIPELQKHEVTFTLSGVQDEEKAKTIVSESEKYCLVSNAMKTENHFSYVFNA